MRIAAIVAMAENRVIGYQNKLPWHLPADLLHFKQVTMGKPILMGRKTYESIGRPLPGRSNIVITQNKTFHAPGCSVVDSIASALDSAFESSFSSDEIVVIGGALLYEHMLPRIQRIYMTIIHHEFIGDAYFPQLNMSDWLVSERIDHQPDDRHAYGYSFMTYDRGTTR